MSFSNALPIHLRPRREKVFGEGRPRPMDGNTKARIMTYARSFKRRRGKGRHYGQLTPKYLDVLEVLLWTFHNARTGLCFPSLEKIAEAAGCARSTVAEALKALEATGVLTWVNRIKRVRDRVAGLFGDAVGLTRVVRTSNGYRFNDPHPQPPVFPSKSEFQSGTSNQDIFPSIKDRSASPSPLEMALTRLGEALGIKEGLSKR
jgi:AraC-like DNA-binding protein